MKFPGRQNKKNTNSECFIYSQSRYSKLKYDQEKNVNCVVTNKETQYYAKGNKRIIEKTIKDVHNKIIRTIDD